MLLNFSCNLSTMFKEVPFIQRFEKAKLFNFKAVEIQNPYDEQPDILKKHLGELKCDLINLYPGSSMGCAADPLAQEDFLESTQKAMVFYNSLSFKKLHIMSGFKDDKYGFDHQFTTYVESLKSLVSSDFLENINVTGLIEPICPDVCSNYFLNSFDLALDILREVDSDQIKLLLDVYHLHKITGDVHKYLEKYYPYAGHIQISQDPGRHEPFCPGGNIDYQYVFDFLIQKNHKDYIGLEYFPSGSTEDSLQWMKKYQA